MANAQWGDIDWDALPHYKFDDDWWDMARAVNIDLEVEVDIAWLQEQVQKNREAHKATYDKAFQKYREEVVKFQEQVLDELKSGATGVRYWNKAVPQDYTADYDLVLTMLKQAADSTAAKTKITVTASDFRHFVQDEWDWTDQFNVTNASYGVQ